MRGETRGVGESTDPKGFDALEMLTKWLNFLRENIFEGSDESWEHLGKELWRIIRKGLQGLLGTALPTDRSQLTDFEPLSLAVSQWETQMEEGGWDVRELWEVESGVSVHSLREWHERREDFFWVKKAKSQMEQVRLLLLNDKREKIPAKDFSFGFKCFSLE